MDLMAWSYLLSTGVSEQDAQHRELFKLINQHNDAMLSGKGNVELGNVLSELLNYSKIHFNYEEELMMQHKYRDLTGHKAEHAVFIQFIEDYEKKLHVGSAGVSVEVMHFLRNWIVNHVMKCDRNLGRLVLMAERGSQVSFLPNLSLRGESGCGLVMH